MSSRNRIVLLFSYTFEVVPVLSAVILILSPFVNDISSYCALVFRIFAAVLTNPVAIMTQLHE